MVFTVLGTVAGLERSLIVEWAQAIIATPARTAKHLRILPVPPRLEIPDKTRFSNTGF
jgi:hypothetical protein